MQDPSFGIPRELALHVHLLSTHRFPVAARLQLQQVHQYLVEAPKIVKQFAPMAWTYLSAPADGTVLLTWAPPQHNGQFPSDGYIWTGPEERGLQEIGGYTIEILIQHAGFKPHAEGIACHQRRRYRLVQKNPNVNAIPPDPNLWIVHYSQAEQQRMVQASQVTISRQQQMQFQQRSFIEGQGQLEHREFMLHDRERWPQLRFTGQGRIQAVQSGAPPMAAQQSPMPHMGNQRFAPQQFQQQQAQAGMGPSPAKRQRTSVAAAAPAQAPAPEFYDVEAEEEYAMGDYLDTLNQREVSKARYLVHHEWMEEVFSSPYMTRQIAPAYLGFGLMGELSGLTEGIFTTVADAVKLYTDAGEVAADKMEVGGSIPADKLKQFEDRVNEFMDNGQAELERMKQDHARKMEEMRKGRSLSKAEKRLRNAKWASGDSSVPAVLNGLVSGKGAKEDAEAIVSEVSSDLKRSITSQPLINMIARGGFREQQPEPPAPVAPVAAPVAAPPAPAAAPPQQIPQPAPTFDADEQMETLDASAFEIEGMDLDIGSGSDFNFGDDALNSGPGTGVAAVGTPAAAPAAPPVQAPVPPPVAAPVPAPDAEPQADDTAFDDFTEGIDFGGADEELGDLGMDNSAFGEAFGDTPQA